MDRIHGSWTHSSKCNPRRWTRPWDLFWICIRILTQSPCDDPIRNSWYAIFYESRCEIFETILKMESKRKLPEIRVWANILIREDWKILLLKRKGGYWDWTWCFPGWHYEEDITIIDATIRETREELWIQIEKEHISFVTTSDRREWDIVYIQFLHEAILFKGDPINNEPSKAYEIRFFDINELPKDIFPPHLPLILYLSENNYS